jgi:hypothetical protein
VAGLGNGPSRGRHGLTRGGRSGARDALLASRFDRQFLIYKYPVACRAFYIEADPARPEVELSRGC